MRGLKWFILLCIVAANSLQAQPFFLRQDVPVGESTLAVVSGDFNGDNHPDLAVFDWYEGLFTQLNRGDGALDRRIPAGIQMGEDVIGYGPGFLSVADIDGDGKDDLVFNEGAFLSRGDGTFQPGQRIYNTSGLHVVTSGDFNEDGKSDLLVSGDSAGTRVLLSNGDGTFQPGPTLSAARHFGAVADFNGDGHSDLILSGAYPSGHAVFLGNGDATFGAGIPIAGVAQYAAAEFFVADFNGDGVADLATQNGVLLSGGDGSFHTPVPFPWLGEGIAGHYLYAAADLTSDGKADLVTGVGGTSCIFIHPGNGDGTFSPPLEQPVGWGDRMPYRVVAADLDGDEGLDLVVANNSSSTVSVLMCKDEGGPTLRRAVSAASDTAVVAPQSLATLYVATPVRSTAAASPPWPTELGGLSLEVRDSIGVAHLAPLLFVSPTQINFQVPAGTASGEAVLAIVDNGATTEAGSMQVDTVAPGLFMVSPGVVAATAVVYSSESRGDPIPVFTCTGSAEIIFCQLVPLPLSTANTIYLSFYGTGFRGANPENVICTDLITGIHVPVLYAGPQGTPGLDQINVGPLPAELLNDWGSFEVSIRIEGVAANLSRVHLQ